MGYISTSIDRGGCRPDRLGQRSQHHFRWRTLHAIPGHGPVETMRVGCWDGVVGMLERKVWGCWCGTFSMCEVNKTAILPGSYVTRLKGCCDG